MGRGVAVSTVLAKTRWHGGRWRGECAAEGHGIHWGRCDCGCPGQGGAGNQGQARQKQASDPRSFSNSLKIMSCEWTKKPTYIALKYMPNKEVWASLCPQDKQTAPGVVGQRRW